MPDKRLTALWFDTGDHRWFDVRPYLEAGDFRRLKDEALFRQVQAALDTVCWPGGLDMAPDTLFDRSLPVDEVTNVHLTVLEHDRCRKCFLPLLFIQ